MSSRNKQAEESQCLEAIRDLRKLCRPGTTVYTVLRWVSRTGDSREIACYIVKNGAVRGITGYVAWALRLRMGRRDGVIVGGCGMDMGYHIVNELSYALHGMEPKGDGALPENRGRIFEPRPEHYRSGYSLNHRWL